METIAPQVKIAIIGAGFAGIGMAIRLKQEGEQALALEPGKKILIAFAVWDGASRRRGRKGSG